MCLMIADFFNYSILNIYGDSCLCASMKGSQQPIDTGHSEAGSIHGRASHVIARPSSTEASHRIPGASGVEEEQQVLERPKLILKPRSQPVDYSDESTKKER